MNIKKIAITALLGMSVVGLTGCGDSEESKALKKKDLFSKNTPNGVYQLLTNKEKKLLSPTISEWDYGRYTLLDDVYIKRQNKPSEESTPFCDVLPSLLKLEEESWNENFISNAPYQLWERIEGESLTLSCDEKRKRVKLKQEIQEDDNTVVVENGDTQEEILSPKIIDEITEASAECFSAKVKMVDIIDDKGYLTKQDYPEIMKLISKCKMHKLRVEVESN